MLGEILGVGIVVVAGIIVFGPRVPKWLAQFKKKKESSDKNVNKKGIEKRIKILKESKEKAESSEDKLKIMEEISVLESVLR